MRILTAAMIMVGIFSYGRYEAKQFSQNKTIELAKIACYTGYASAYEDFNLKDEEKAKQMADKACSHFDQYTR